jgi:hypothetical protein
MKTMKVYRPMKIIADQFRKKGFKVYEEVTALDDGRSLRRSHIKDINKWRGYGLIIDPTLRLETNENQFLEVQEEKANIYSKPNPYYSKKYNIPKFEVQ